jgi:hypothetical protein
MENARSTAKWLGIIVVMQGLILLTLWGSGPSVPIAKADGIPDAGAQRQQMIEQIKATNDKLDKLLALLSGGDLQVKVAKPDDAKGHE